MQGPSRIYNTHPINIESLSAVIKGYELFLIDAWGTIHNGEKLYPGVATCFAKLNEMGKRVVIFSNAPRAEETVSYKLQQLGLEVGSAIIVTSGMFFLAEVAARTLYCPPHNAKVYVFGKELNSYITSALERNYALATQIEDADFAVMCSFVGSEELLSQHDEEFKLAITKGVPLLCPNPDFIAPSGDMFTLTPGAFCKRYENLGGEVYYYGKPYREFFDFAVKMAEEASDTSFDKSQIIMIGDSLTTDVMGANNYGIDSLLLTQGLHRGEDIANLIEVLNARPTYIMEQLDYVS